jgi:hypothetical protein
VTDQQRACLDRIARWGREGTPLGGAELRLATCEAVGAALAQLDRLKARRARLLQYVVNAKLKLDDLTMAYRNDCAALRDQIDRLKAELDAVKTRLAVISGSQDRPIAIDGVTYRWVGFFDSGYKLAVMDSDGISHVLIRDTIDGPWRRRF